MDSRRAFVPALVLAIVGTAGIAYVKIRDAGGRAQTVAPAAAPAPAPGPSPARTDDSHPAPAAGDPAGNAAGNAAARRTAREPPMEQAAPSAEALREDGAGAPRPGTAKGPTRRMPTAVPPPGDDAARPSAPPGDSPGGNARRTAVRRAPRGDAPRKDEVATSAAGGPAIAGGIVGQPVAAARSPATAGAAAADPAGTPRARVPGGALPPETPAQDEPEPVVEEPVRPALVRMLPSPSDPLVGSRIALDVQILDASEVGHAPFHVRFNPAVLEYESAEEGPFLNGDGQPTAFFASPTADGTTVVVGLSRLGRGPGIDGSGLLCRLNFVAIGPGDAGLAFDRGSVRDAENVVGPAIFQPASVVVR